MKRFILGIALAVLPLLAMPQNHLTFMGVAIDGAMLPFVEKMKAKGFTLVEKYGNVTVMKGAFTGETVELYIKQTPITKKIYKVSVFYLDDRGVPTDSDYNRILGCCKEKYTLDKTLDKMSFFHAEFGVIVVEINNRKQLEVTYYDTKNNKLYLSETRDAVLNDI